MIQSLPNLGLLQSSLEGARGRLTKEPMLGWEEG